MIEKIFIILALGLLIIQAAISSKQSIFKVSTLDQINIQQRMNDYPSKLFRLAHILEERKESVGFYKWQSNFFGILNFKKIFFIFIPLILVGLFRLIEKKKYWLLLFTLGLPLMIISMMGIGQTFGNFCMYPFILLSLKYGFNKVFFKK